MTSLFRASHFALPTFLMFSQYFLPWLWCQAFLFAESPYLLSPLGTVLSLQTWTMALHFNFRCKMREKARSWFISRLFHYFSCRSGCVSTLLSILCSWFWVGQVTSIKPTKTFSGKKKQGCESYVVNHTDLLNQGDQIYQRSTVCFWVV